MRTVFIILQKEFIQIFRDKTMLPVIFVMPIIQLIILVNAATFDMKRIDLAVVDRDNSSVSRELTGAFRGSPFYRIVRYENSGKVSGSDLITGKADAILEIPAGFERGLIRENKAPLQLRISAINSSSAGLIQAYSNRIIMQFNNNIRHKYLTLLKPQQLKSFNIIPTYWYNPEMNYKTFMLPGILVVLVTAIGMILTAINIVREKEMGTMEQINVTPIRKVHFIIGKLVPFWIIALFELAFGLVIGKLLYAVPIQGNLLILFGLASIYLVVVLGIGLFISTVSTSQQQVMFVAFFFMIIFILTSGIFTPVESMPDWAIKADLINPVAYFMRAIRMIMLKGSALADVRREFIYLSVYGLVILSLAVWRFRKVS